MDANISRRQSGRARTKPDHYTPVESSRTSLGGTKRKRTSTGFDVSDSEEDNDDEDEEEQESSSDDEEDDEDGEHEPPKRSQKKAPNPKTAASKPSAKKPRAAPTASRKALPLRPGKGAAKKTNKAKKASSARAGNLPAQHNELYEAVFSSDSSMEDVVHSWFESYKAHATNALCELINFVLACTGCPFTVDVHAIEDPDNATGKLSDLQDEYQAQKVTDYPLISRNKGVSFSRPLLVEFFSSLIEALEQSGTLYDDKALLENIQTWVATMSSSSIRPFRHTATVISLAIGSAICNLSQNMLVRTATFARQRQSEAKKTKPNKKLMTELSAKEAELQSKQDALEELMKDTVDAVFVHRYRDVDPRVRADCAATLTSWMTTWPDQFFKSEYLRYLGWILPDPVSSVRSEVLKQLVKLYKGSENVARLHGFTEKFRSRMIEMAEQDVDVNVRVIAIDLLANLKNLGLVGIEDLEAIGKLVFDSEPRIRKAVTQLVSQLVDDQFETEVENLGGLEKFQETFGDELDPADLADGDDAEKGGTLYSWLRLKCIIQKLRAYEQASKDHTPELSSLNHVLDPMSETRMLTAAQVAIDGMEQSRHWQSIVEYLLHDHSSKVANSGGDDFVKSVRQAVVLSEEEERVMLDLLYVSVRYHLSGQTTNSADKKGRSLKAKEDAQIALDKTASALVSILPKLLKRFGEGPSCTAAVLKLEHLLDREVLLQLRQDSSEYSKLVEDVGRLFLSHADEAVLREATITFLHARDVDDSADASDDRLGQLLKDVAGDFVSAASRKSQKGLLEAVSRLSSLVGITNCSKIFDVPLKGGSKAGLGSDIRELLLNLVDPEDASSTSASVLTSDEKATVTNHAMKCLQFYYLWVVSACREAIAAGRPLPPVKGVVEYSNTLMNLARANQKLSAMRTTSLGNFLDIRTTLATLRGMLDSDSPLAPNVQALVPSVSATEKDIILATFIALEKSYAKLSKRSKSIETAEIDNDEMDVEGAPESGSEAESDHDMSDDEQGLQNGTQGKVKASRKVGLKQLLSEKQLCELTGKIVLAILAKVIDAESSNTANKGRGTLRKRILLNKTKLGPNFKEVLNHLDVGTEKKRGGRKAQNAKTKTAKTPAVVEDEDDEDIEEAAEEGGEEELRRRELLENPDDEDQEGAGNANDSEGDEESVIGD